MNQLLSIDGDRLIIEKLRVKWTEGSMSHAGSLEVIGATKLNDGLAVKGNASVTGTIIADTINVKHIICDEPKSITDPFAFAANTAKELDGKGFHFTDGGQTRQFVFKENGRMWSTMHLDLSRGNSYQIENIPVLTANTLGDSIVNSNLQNLGTLQKLKVSGNAEFGQWAFFNSSHNRLGLNTDNPNSTLSIVDNNVEIILGSRKTNIGYIGTFNNSDLEIGTDNTSRITLKNNGEIVFGSPKYKNAVIRIHGKLEVDEIVNDPRDSVSHSLIFKSKKNNTMYGTGIIWQDGDSSSFFTYEANPNRIHSSEIIDIARDKWYSIESSMVLSRNSLGNSVTHSNLTKIGILEDLEVDGDSNFHRDISVNGQIIFKDNNRLSLDKHGISSKNYVCIVCDDEQELKIDSAGSIEIGNKQNISRKINVFGQLAINVTNPDPDVSFTVSGNVSLGDKKFINGPSKPISGTYKKGDICWNTEPEATSYIGWVCIREGTPGEWIPFGQIAG